MADGDDDNSNRIARKDDGARVRTAGIVTLAVIAVVVALFFGRPFFVPIALAILLNTLLRPIVRAMQRVKIPAPIGATIVVLSLVGAMVGCGFALDRPVQRWFSQLPGAFDKARGKVENLIRPVQKAAATAQQIQRQATDLTRPPTSAPSTQSSTTQPAPPADAHVVPPTQTVSPEPPGFLDGVLGRTTTLLGELVEVLVLLLLLLAGGNMYVQKLVHAVRGPESQSRVRNVVRGAHDVVLRYMLVTATINLAQGAMVAAVMWSLGMPAPLLWGLFTFVLEFVPYLGATVMIALLSIVALATLDGPFHIVAAPGSYLLITTIQNNVVSPIAYGQGLKLNPVSILIGVLFWWFIWGTPGAFLAVPMLATLKIIADHFPRMKPVAELLGE